MREGEGRANGSIHTDRPIFSLRYRITFQEKMGCIDIMQNISYYTGTGAPIPIPIVLIPVPESLNLNPKNRTSVKRATRAGR